MLIGAMALVAAMSAAAADPQLARMVALYDEVCLRTFPDDTSESLFFFDQHITDPKRRAAGETGVVLRFVHQFAPAPPSNAKP